MTDLQEKINEAFKLISTISVSGDAVDIMAAARACLRSAYNLAAGTEGNGDG